MIFAPATALFNRLKYSQKFTLIGLIILLPFAITLYLLVSELNIGIEFAQKERMGLKYSYFLGDILKDIQKHRGITSALLSGDISSKEKQLDMQAHVGAEIGAIDTIDQRFGYSLKTTEKWRDIKKRWNELKERVPNLSAQESFDLHTVLIGDILSFIHYVAETSNLIFDPQPDTYYLVDALVLKLPTLSEDLGQARALGSGIAARKVLSDDDRITLRILYLEIKSAVDVNNRGFETAFRENPGLQLKLEKYVTDSVNAINEFLKILDRELIKAERIEIEADDYFQIATKAIDAVFTTYDETIPELNHLLITRIDHFSKEKTIAWIIAAGALLAVTYLFMAFFISVVPSLKEMAVSAQRIASGDLKVNVAVKAKDEVGILGNAFNHMVVSLRQSIEEQQRVYEKERQRTQQMAILYETVSAITSDLALEAVLERLASYTAFLVRAELSAIMILHPNTGAIQYFKTNVPQDAFPVKQIPEGKGLLGTVLRKGDTLRLDNASGDRRFEGLPEGHPSIGNLLGVPLLFKNKVIGGLFVANKQVDGSFTKEDENLLMMLAFQSATAVENARLYAKTVEMATTDSLTGLANRRLFIEHLTNEIERSSRYEHTFCLFMVDIDHFKVINDVYGHPAGDAVLQSLVRIFKGHVRVVDIVSRYGGEEFAVILPETDASSAKSVGERLRKAVANTSFLLPNGGEAVRLTVSIGIAAFPACGHSVKQLIERADKALYTAKEMGRNRVCL